jgi:polar amino acid transport system substrate-binding protein
MLLVILIARLVIANQPDASLRRVQEAGVLVVAFDASYPPFETTDGQGNFGGFDADLGREIARRLGVEVRFANIAFDNLYDAQFNRLCDVIISGLRYEAERTRDVIYSVPYFDAGPVFVVRAGDPASKSSDMAGRRVGVETASEADVELRKLATRVSGMQIRGYETREDAVAAVRQGAADAAATDYVSALALIKGQPDLRVILPPFAADPLVIAGHSADRTLLNEINRLLRAMREDGTLAHLAQSAFAQE